ncbi:uncharacterized protein LOC9663159 [Selaginella moellendorffii]|uniref:uncharacterized protein LOC9663159 n=1 Tax=Selaginella moellendorffii TaxID=88036 RepID=UPI000D1C63F5|nr:uncharacterized protein LOC9663159 [Selaginella moellendorffii]|eukprot:XP_024531459.1 uncharacterized protein LOC9663159 [Selaginella moellendorffii]
MASLLWILSLLSGCLWAQAQVPVLTRAPALVTAQRNATFEFMVKNASGGNDACSDCAIQCKLDGSPFHDCASRGDSYSSLIDGDHVFEVSIQRVNSSASVSYNWTVDSIAPTGSITVDREFTNALNATLHIILSESCAGDGGFKCSDIANCPVATHGPGSIVPSSLRVIRPNLEYNLVLNLSAATQSGRVIVALGKEFCSDLAGNKFRRGDNSSVIVRFDRTPVDVNLWTGITEVQVVVNKQPRSLQVTRDIGDLGIFLDFSRPIVNTTEEILGALNVTDGVLQPTERKSHGKRRYGFLLTNISDSAVVTVQLQGGLQSRDGTYVLQSNRVSFLYDRKRPELLLSPSSSVKTRKRTTGVWIEFSEPVFLFDSLDFNLSAGKVTRLSEITKSKYFAELLIPADQVVTVFISENKTTDIAGNPNLASNQLQVRHYSPPAIAVASSCFVTAGILATFITSGLVSIASTSLGGAGAITSRTVSSIVSNPSGNLLGMAGHLQVFALSYYASTNFPVEYSETVRSMKWFIPHVKLPWEKQQSILSHKLHYQANSPYSLDYLETRRKLGSNTTLYGPALSSDEYRLFFQMQHGESVVLEGKYNGWNDFGKNMFWLGVFGGGFVLFHLLLLYFLRWRTEATLRGALSLPRFEIFLLYVALPCICQAAAFIIRGGTTGGIIVGVLLLAVPTGFFLSVLMFLLVAVIWGALVQYKEYRSQAGGHVCRGVVRLLLGESHIGKWVRKEGLSSSFIPKFGLLFENRKGPPRVVYVDEDYGSKWVDSEGKGIGRMKPVNSDEDSVDMSVSKAHKLIGAARVFYIMADIARRATLGIVFGVHPGSEVSWRQLSLALAVTLIQLLYLILFKPYIRRGVHLVESVSLLCELAVFSIGMALLPDDHSSDNRRSLGIAMVTLLLSSFMCQLINEWYALMEKLLKLSAPQEPSFEAGMRMLGKGLVFPFIPQRKWPKFITPPQQPRIGLVPVVHLSPSPDFQQRSKVLPSSSPISFTETGGPAYDPGSPSLVDPRSLGQQSRASSGSGRLLQPAGSFHKVPGHWSRSVSFEGKKTRPSRSDTNSSELKTLRELARASFPGSKREEQQQSSAMDSSQIVAEDHHGTS